MPHGYNIYQVDVEDGGRERHLGTWTDEDVANTIINRLRLRDQADMTVDYNLRPVAMDPTAEMLNLPLTLSEMVQGRLVEAACGELLATGSVMMPLWVNPSWLIYELRQRYGVGINRSGRRLTIVEKSEEVRPSPSVVFEAEDGVQEAWSASADAVMGAGTDADDSAAYSLLLAAENDGAGFQETS